ncbi:MFS transporter [Sphaerimonospora cavernae]|uniref:MFS transporter n=1 Tax=Sphaerimonospora cavernae TaxID=1740611 RepID=A0ABV6U6R8_9ACTN
MTAPDREPQENRLWTARTWPFIVAILALETFIAFEAFAVTTVLPVTMSSLNGPEWYSLSYAATITTALVGMIVGGNWTDRSGTRVPLVFGGTLFVLGIALCALAPNAAVFILGRLLQGVGGGIDAVVLYVLIAQRIPAGPRAKMFGLLTAAWLLPSMIGPVLAGLLTELVSWRTVFGFILAGAAVSLVGLLTVTRGFTSRSQSTPSAPALFGRQGVIALVAAGLLLILHLSGQLPLQQSMIAISLALVGLALTAGRLLPPGTLRLRGVAQRLVALRAALGATVTATDVYLTLYLQSERGFPPTTAGVVIAIGAAGWAGGAWLQGRFSDALDSHRRLITTAALLVASGPACVALYILDVTPLWLVVAACVTMGLGMGIAYPRIATATLAIVDESEHGKYSSALQAGESMSIAALLAVSAALLTAVSGVGGFTLVYVLLVAGSALAILIASAQRRDQSEWGRRRDWAKAGGRGTSPL